MNEERTIIRYDNAICSGCLCKVVSKKLGEPLNTACHGNPSIKPADSPTYIICPCSECVVKMICRTVCDMFCLYKDLQKGTINTKQYEKWRKELTNGTTDS